MSLNCKVKKSVHSNKHIGLTMVSLKLKLLPIIILQALATSQTNSSSTDTGKSSCSSRTDCADPGKEAFYAIVGFFSLLCSIILVLYGREKYNQISNHCKNKPSGSQANTEAAGDPQTQMASPVALSQV